MDIQLSGWPTAPVRCPLNIHRPGEPPPLRCNQLPTCYIVLLVLKSSASTNDVRQLVYSKLPARNGSYVTQYPPPCTARQKQTRLRQIL